MTAFPSNEKLPDYAPPPIRTEPTNRWIRVKFNGETVADSKQAVLLIRYSREGLPTYYFPASGVRQEFLEPGSKFADGKEYFNLRVGDKTAENAAWVYRNPPENLTSLKDYYSFEWNLMAAWYEEDDRAYEHAKDPYHRVDTLPSSRHVQVFINGVQVADSKRPSLVFETMLPTRYYLPQADVRMDLLQPTTLHTRCPYKGVASYWSVQAGDSLAENIAWGYLDPIAEQPKLKDLICFYNEKVDLVLDGESVPRPVTPFS